jgi:hypothetical protein
MESKTYSGPSAEWLWETAEIEATCRSVSVGGLATDLGMIDKTVWSDEPVSIEALAGDSKAVSNAR